MDRLHCAASGDCRIAVVFGDRYAECPGQPRGVGVKRLQGPVHQAAVFRLFEGLADGLPGFQVQPVGGKEPVRAIDQATVCADRQAGRQQLGGQGGRGVGSGPR